MQMFLISDNIDTYTGMRLAGVEGVVVHTHDELKDALQKAISNKEIGIILLTEKFGREFPEIINDVKLQDSEGVLKPGFGSYSREELEGFCKVLRENIQSVEIRGID